ncbi:MAG: SRPBCC family protein [Geobacteraceae bacterium]|nr:SRPBCC family protein [Geobacteraceae bacterium]
MYTLKRTQILPTPLQTAWQFFSDPRNLPVITPPDLGFEITSELPEQMYAGMVVTYKVTALAGVRVNWVTEITHVREPDFFVDEQRFGPYRFWHHQHLFRAVEGGTEMVDQVSYLLPFQPFGQLAAPFIRKRLEYIFDYRHETIAKLLV